MAIGAILENNYIVHDMYIIHKFSELSIIFHYDGVLNQLLKKLSILRSQFDVL